MLHGTARETAESQVSFNSFSSLVALATSAWDLENNHVESRLDNDLFYGLLFFPLLSCFRRGSRVKRGSSNADIMDSTVDFNQLYVES